MGLLFVLTSLGLVIWTLPGGMIAASGGVLFPEPGPAMPAVLLISGLQGVLGFALLALVPWLALPRGSGGTARLVAWTATAAVVLSLVLLLTAGLFEPGPEGGPVLAFLATAGAAILGLVTGLEGLALAAGLALRLPGGAGRTAALAATGVIAAVAATYLPIGWHGGVGAALALLVGPTALALWRRGGLPGGARPWLAALLAVWLLPWLAEILPATVEALAVGAPGLRMQALAAALSHGPDLAWSGAAGTLLVVAVLVALRRGSAARRPDGWLALLLAASILLPDLARAAGGVPYWAADWPALAGGPPDLLSRALGLLVSLGTALQAPAAAAAGGWLLLRGNGAAEAPPPPATA